MNKAGFSAIALLAVIGSTSFGQMEPTVDGAAITEESIVTWTEMAPLIQKRCAMCHNGKMPIPNWMDYQTAWSKCHAIQKHVVVLKDMPKNMPMAQAERDMFAKWVELGAPFSLESYVPGATCGDEQDQHDHQHVE